VLLEPWRANDRERYRQGLPWDDTVARLGLSALAALHRGSRALETAILEAVGSALHVEDLLAYVRTGESRSQLLERLTAEPGAASTELLRAFAALAGMTAGPTESAASSALEALTSAARTMSPAEGPGGVPGRIRFVEQQP
jgi:hypothetical protein